MLALGKTVVKGLPKSVIVLNFAFCELLVQNNFVKEIVCVKIVSCNSKEHIKQTKESEPLTKLSVPMIRTICMGLSRQVIALQHSYI